MINKVMRLFRTVKHLKAKQFFYFVKRRFFPLVAVNAIDSSIAKNTIKLDTPLYYDQADQPYQFVFLNETELFKGGDIDWISDHRKRLWVYNLHYFDYLRSDRPFDEKLHLIKHWIVHNPQNQTPGWEPFTCSLRIVNWIFFIVQYDVDDKEILESLYLQALWLEKNDEKHILANHYFENLKALLFASYFFQGADADRWFSYASENLAKQIVEQFLEDGGHYERTPQYHGLMLENLLDLYNLIQNNSLRSYEHQAVLKSTLLTALDFYNKILMPDGSLSMFNDTAQGISPSLNEFCEYAQRMGLSISVDNHAIVDCPQSGLFAYKNDQDMWIIDAGDIGPSYQPGHTHCDMLSYELFVSGHPVVVDTGVSEYQPGEMRRYVRSTKAHNTLQVGSHEQSEVWGEFRVGERAQVKSAHIKRLNQVISFEGEINAFRLLSKSICHKRRGELNLSSENEQFQSLMIEDTLSGLDITGDMQIYSYIHFHPAIQVSLTSEREVALSNDDLTLSLIVNGDDVNLSLEKCAYCPEFGVLRDSVCLVLSKNATMFDEIKYSIIRVDS